MEASRREQNSPKDGEGYKRKLVQIDEGGI